MLRDIVIGFKLIKHSNTRKIDILIIALFLCIGVIVEISSRGLNFLVGFYIAVSILCIYEQVEKVAVFTLVQSSGLKKALQTVIPVVTSFVLEIFLFTLLLIERIILINMYPENRAELLKSLFMVIVILLLCVIYCTICLKFYVVSTVIFVFMAGALSAIGNMELFRNSMSLPLLAAIGYITIVVGAASQYLISNLMYKYSFSKFVFRRLVK
ncbi:MAG: hypothetical protein LKG26_04760 [Saccharofermentans sp.]|jgi:hypothetical protein|nr:hypothetical protein [Mageeibacillus sp.]MCI1275378.1 hypothetical protein [Saccharofermentans sp.]